MRCSRAKSLLSPYLDGMIPGKEMLALGEHLENCVECHDSYMQLRRTQQLVSQAGKRKAPDDLNLRLRLAISREIARSKQPFMDGLRIRMENAVNAFMLPATGGLASAVVAFAILMGFLTLPLQAGKTDVPLMWYTAPQLQQSAFGTAMDSIKDDSLVIEAYVDSNGRVQDYRILSNPEATQDLPPQVKNMLIFTTFRPATSMGQPTAGKAVLSFSKISVKG